MSENRELKKENGQQPETPEQGEDVEGYAYCNTHKQKCLTDCFPVASPVLSVID